MRIFAHFSIEPCVVAHPNRLAIRLGGISPPSPVRPGKSGRPVTLITPVRPRPAEMD
ncbi:hypothetical protein COCOBI_pt-0340 (chloroplast) [Coccomyxa sp. Obi]|nr:hypothetical protein COCOBI_pt-0340 [Coccomyxa sp. Obi]